MDLSLQNRLIHEIDFVWLEGRTWWKAMRRNFSLCSAFVFHFFSRTKTLRRVESIEVLKFLIRL